MGTGTMNAIPPPPDGFQLDQPSVDPMARYQMIHEQLASLPAQERQKAFAALSPDDQAIVQHGIQQIAQAAMSPQAVAQNYARDQAQQTQDMGAYGRFMAGAGKSVMDTARGIGQLIGAESDQDIANARAQDAALMDTTAGKLGRFAGGVAQTVIPGGAAVKGLRALGMAGKVAPYIGSALAGGAFSGSQPVGQGESRAINTAVGTAGGLIGQAIPGALGALAKKAAPALSPVKQAAIEVAQKYGIPLHLSQVTDSKALQTLASAAKYLPFAGNAAARDAQQAAFNGALGKQIGENNVTNFTDEVLARASQKIGQAYDDLFARNTVKLTPDDATKLTNIINAANKFGGSDVGQTVGNHVDAIINELDTDGTMPGRLYQALRTDQLMPAEKTTPAASHYIRQVRQVLQNAANRSMQGNDAQELAKLNGQYNSLKIIQQGINKRVDGAGGDVAPARLWGLANGKYGSTQEMRELARLGQTILKDPIPDSGTAARNVVYRGMTTGVPGMATLPPLSLLGATAGRVLNSPTAANVLPLLPRNALLGLSVVTKPAPYLLPPLAQQ